MLLPCRSRSQTKLTLRSPMRSQLGHHRIWHPHMYLSPLVIRNDLEAAPTPSTAQHAQHTDCTTIPIEILPAQGEQFTGL